MGDAKTKEYLINRVKTASPIELVVIVYDTAIFSLEGVKENWKNKNYSEATKRIIKAQKCVQELKRALNMEIEEMSHQLFSMYRAIDKILLKAQRERKEDVLDRALKMLTELRDTWKEVAKKEPKMQQHVAHATGASFINTYK